MKKAHLYGSALFVAVAVSVVIVVFTRDGGETQSSSCSIQTNELNCQQSECAWDANTDACVELAASFSLTTPSPNTSTFFPNSQNQPSVAPTLALVPSPQPTASPLPSESPSSQPSPAPTTNPTSTPTATPYFPGDLTVRRFDRNGVRITLSTGMDGRAIAYSGSRVQFQDGSQSSINFHSRPDAAGCFPSDTGGFYYSSNSESNSGGVGVLEFDADGNVIDYYRTLTGTDWNCGGGKTPWGTWISCEENDSSGRVWQTDPAGLIPSQRTEVVARGGNYESFAYDDRSPTPFFFTTEDSSTGALVRFTPDSTALGCYNSPTPAEKWCTLNSGTYDYLRVDSGSSGTFSWGPRDQATPGRYPNAEGIDVVNGKLFFVSKADRTLFELDLDAGTFIRTSTVSGSFNLQPDQFKAISPSDPNNMIYFCEDGGSNCDVHGRNSLTGEYFTIVTGDGYSTETTGLGFSPDGKYMLISFQEPGVIWQLWREDGLPFDGQIIDVKYHSEQRRRLLEETSRLRLGKRNFGPISYL